MVAASLAIRPMFQMGLSVDSGFTNDMLSSYYRFRREGPHLPAHALRSGRSSQQQRHSAVIITVVGDETKLPFELHTTTGRKYFLPFPLRPLGWFPIDRGVVVVVVVASS